MSEGQKSKEKRKIQNRNAQRRFIFFNPVFSHPNDENTESTSGSELNIALPTTAQSEFQGFGGSRDLNSLLGHTSEDLFAGMSGAFVSKPWLRPPYLLSSPSEDIHPVNGWKAYDSLGSQVDPAAHLNMSFTNHTGDTLFTLNDAARNPPRSASSRAKTTHLDAGLGCSQAVHSAAAFNGPDPEYPFLNSQRYLKVQEQRSLSARKSKKHVGCCVAHKAGEMVSDLQKLYSYGVRFGFFEDEDDEVEDCLCFLKRRLKEMGQCSDGDAGFSSDSNSDVKELMMAMIITNGNKHRGLP
ncbi:hypothetical protein LY76DRAFT_640130 [Colletotrichum caudatum]|nr:hypothetical protein LY76DRAFT_640130 [Colletotrichum caudatum]